MEFSLLAIGEVMAEIRKGTSGDFKVGFAGDTYNTAVYCARALNQPGSVAYKTSIGRDPLSAGCIDAARSEGIDTNQISTNPERNIGVYAVSTDASGERSFSYWRASSAARGMFTDHDDVRALPNSRIVYLSGITLAILQPASRQALMNELRILSESGQSLIAFDSNYRAQLWESTDAAQTCLSEMWDIADIALPSIDDEMALFNETSEDAVISRFNEKTWEACAIKRGARGPVSPFLEPHAHPKFKTAEIVIDTTAAGDGFNGAYLAAYIQGQNETECMLSGHELASRIVSAPGAIVSQSRR